MDELVLFRRSLEDGDHFQFVRDRLTDNPQYLRVLEQVIVTEFLRD
jgi:hypothetical protein